MAGTVWAISMAWRCLCHGQRRAMWSTYVSQSLDDGMPLARYGRYARRHPGVSRPPVHCTTVVVAVTCSTCATTDQLAYKTAQVQDAMARIGKLPDVPVAPMLESPQPFNYRNKVLYHYDAVRGALGLVARHEAQILDVPHCLLNDPRADAVLARVRTLAATEPALRRVLHQVQVQVGQRTGEVLVTIFVRAALAASAAASALGQPA